MRTVSFSTGVIATVLVLWVMMLWVLIGTDWPGVLSQLGQLIRDLQRG